MKKKIYAVLLLTAVCAGSGVFAQSSAPKENLENIIPWNGFVRKADGSFRTMRRA